MAVSTSDIAQRADMVCRRGNSFLRSFTFTTNGTTPTVFTGATFAMRIVDGLGNTILLTAPTILGNVVTVAFTKVQMLVPAGNYQYDLELTQADSSVVTQLYGFFIVNKDITTP